MKNKIFPIVSIYLSLLAFETKAMDPLQPIPQICPSVSAIQSVGVSQNVTQDDVGQWVTGRRNQSYGTGSSWTFIVARIDAVSVADAYSKATMALSTLMFQLGPVMGPLGKWVCYYSVDQDYTVVAINPAIAWPLSAAQY